MGERVAAFTGKTGVDAVIELDLAANAGLIPTVLRPKGTVVVYGTGKPEAQIPATFCLVNAVRLQFVFVYELTPEERARAVDDITAMLKANALVHNVAKTFPLAEIVAAHQLVESGTAVGNVVMEL